MPVEVGHDEIGDADEFDEGISPDIASMLEELGFPSPAAARLMTLDHQISQKLHAASAPGSERAHDLIDLQLIVARTPDIDWPRVRATCVRLFAYRQAQAWPPTIIEGEAWATAYDAQAEGLDVLPSVGEAVTWANDLVRRIDEAG
ncbi:MAG: nucleotidyl transferase AbiEii/AbiGii toxin family protein [Coriobacteriales bacterium]